MSDIYNSLTDDEKNILGIIRIIEQKPKNKETNDYIINENLRIKLDFNGVIAVGKLRFKDEVDNWVSAFESLVEKDLLLLDEKIFTLTDRGRALGKQISTKWSSDFYDDLLIRSAESEAHAIFCERVFGKNLYQFNVLDMIQLEEMLQRLNLQPTSYVLDLGCGLGKIAEYISDITEAKFLGIDFSVKAIEWAQKENATKKDRLKYQVMNINEINFDPKTFDAIIAIDTLYFVEDLDVIIGKLKDILKQNGQMGLFWGQQRQPDESSDILEPNKTKLAKALKKSNLNFDVVDFTEVSRELWVRENAAATDLKEMFEKEGNLDLCDWRIIDSKQTMSRIDNNLQKRYFYHVKK